MLWNPWIVLIHRYHSSCCDYGTEKRMGTHEWLNHSSTKTGQAHCENCEVNSPVGGIAPTAFCKSRSAA